MPHPATCRIQMREVYSEIWGRSGPFLASASLCDPGGPARRHSRSRVLHSIATAMDAAVIMS